MKQNPYVRSPSLRIENVAAMIGPPSSFAIVSMMLIEANKLVCRSGVTTADATA